MPRTPRIEVAGGIHHVTAKSTSGRLLFRREKERRLYLDLLAEQVKARSWSVITYCEMTNHLHVVVMTPSADLGQGMKAIHEAFATYVNRTHDEKGHLFGDTFKNRLVLTDRHLVGCLRYVARNPVEARMCRAAAEWKWGAHPALAGLVEPPPFLDVDAALDCFGPNGDQRHAYVRLVGKTDQDLLADLLILEGDSWVSTAVDDYAVPIAEIARFSGLSLSSAYRRLAEAREKKGLDPSLSQGAV